MVPWARRERREPQAQQGPLVQRELPEPLGQQGRPEQQARQDLRESSVLTFWAMDDLAAAVSCCNE